MLAAPIGGRTTGRHICTERLAIAGAAAIGGGLLLLGARTEQTPTIRRIAGLAVQGVGLGLFQLAYSDIVTAARVKALAGLDPIRAADLSLPQWSIRLRSVRILPGATFMLQSSSLVETRDSWIVASVALRVIMMAFDAAWVIAVAC